MPGRRTPLVLDHSTPELQLLQRVRDEAHRFAVTHHRIRRDRAMTGSLLDDLPGIGPARKRALLDPLRLARGRCWGLPARSCRRFRGCRRRSRGSCIRACIAPADGDGNTKVTRPSAQPGTMT